ncbi:MAG: hypothetical protein KJ717_09540 [Proteobacteria bacterium]|nr:hypothetical protein [Pseudomonadota bacterium]
MRAIKMDSEEIGKEVAVRLEIERQVREQLPNLEDQGAARKKSRWAWLDSKLALLIIGAMISGVLIPRFQFTQEKINWQRQNRYNTIERQLGSIRDSLKQFIAVQGISAEFYDLGLELLDTDSSSVRQARLEEWRKDFRSLKARRVQQNSAFAATVFYFPIRSRDSIRKAWNDLLLPVQKLETLVGDLLNDAIGGTDGKVRKKMSENETAVQLDVSLSEVNQAYEHVLTILRNQLQEVENESIKFQ